MALAGWSKLCDKIFLAAQRGSSHVLSSVTISSHSTNWSRTPGSYYLDHSYVANSGILPKKNLECFMARLRNQGENITARDGANNSGTACE